MRHKILLVDDDADFLDFLMFLVGRVGMVAVTARDVPSAITIFENEHPDIAIVDVVLGTWSGFDLVSELRSRSEIPIVMLTGRTSEEDKVRGLDAGADDYLVKPFGPRELVARIRAQLRRNPRRNGHVEDRVVLRAGPLTLNVALHAAAKDGRSLKLTATEFRLLQCLMDHQSTVVPTETLLRDVWGCADAAARDVLRVTLYRLRRKIEDDPTAPRLLHTVPGVGVMLNAMLSVASEAAATAEPAIL